MARTLPRVLSALTMGVGPDRFNRKSLILLADGLRLILVFVVGLVALAAASGPGAVWVLAGLALLLGSAELLRDTTAQSLLPAAVDPDNPERAHGQMWAAEQITGQFIGPPPALHLPNAVDGVGALGMIGYSAWYLRIG